MSTVSWTSPAHPIPRSSPRSVAITSRCVQRRRVSFDTFLRRTLEHCALHVEDSRLTVTGSARTATYTAKQWATIRDVLTRELGRVGEVEVVVVPHTPHRSPAPQDEGGHHARTGS